MTYRAAFISLALVVTTGCVSPPAVEQAVSDGRYVMGTVLEISLFDVHSESAPPILDELYAVAEELDELLSTYKSESTISRLNRTAGRGGERVDGAVAEILKLSIAYSDLTLGTFDVTVGPLSDLWRSATENATRPTAHEISRARSRVGMEKIVEREKGVFYLIQKGMKLDLGGVAKGYALDRMLPHLAQHGIETALLSFGQSSTWALGAPPGSAGWRLLVRGIERDYAGLVTLRDQALSVSESVGYPDEKDTQRYGHIIDPRNGEPVAEPRQAIVVAPQASLAEALSKALLILGADTGLALVAAQPGCEGILIQENGERRSTPGWSAAVRFEWLLEAPDTVSSCACDHPIPWGMGIVDELSCPICSADFALAGDEKPGEEVFCSYCGAPCRLTGDLNSGDCRLEEDI